MFDYNIIIYTCTAGPVVESTMALTLLHTRDVSPNVQFRLSFNVSQGLPSRITCTCDGTIIHAGRGFVSRVNYEIIRPLHVNTSQPEITRVSFEQARPRVEHRTLVLCMLKDVQTLLPLLIILTS